MKRRVIALMCAVTMLAALLSGCGGKQKPEIQTPAISSITSGVNSGTPNSNGNQNSEDTGFTVNAYVDHWSDVRIWAWSDTQGDLFDAWPGEPMQDDGSGWYSYTVPNWVNYVIINGNGGAEQTADLQVESQDCWIIVYFDNSASVTYLDPGYAEDPWANSAIIGGIDSYDPEPEAEPVQPYQTEPQDSGYTAQLDGWWEKVYLQDGSMNLNVTALCLYEPVYNCTGLTVNMEVSMNAGTSCKDWQLWGRSGNTFVKLARIDLPAGDGYISQSIYFDTPVSFDALVVTPTAMGGYSYSMAMAITDVWSD